MMTVMHDHENEVHELKEVEIGELHIVKEQIVTAAFTNLSPALTLLIS